MDLPIDPAVIEKGKAVLSNSFLLAPTSLIRDEEGQIKWGSIITGALTAGLIAASSSLVSMSHDITEIRTIQKQRMTDIEKLPHIEERQKFVLEELKQIKDGNVVATNDRFRGSDGIRMEERINKQYEAAISSLTRRIEDLERRGRR